ncbi:hypothetical protein LUZ60_014969 [Juncus effusus]|nr:hypothetical protein LUZ60_014969 [Juncus effusus]
MAPSSTDQEPATTSATTSQAPLIIGLSLGVGFSFFLFSRAPPPKPLSTAVKFADSAIKIPKVIKTLNPCSPSSLFLASKALLNGYKATTKILPPTIKPSVNLGLFDSKRVKAILGVASLLRYAVSPVSSDGSLLFSLLKFGYKVTKNSAKVLEGFVGLQIDSTISNSVDALGIVVKTAGLVKEVTCWLTIGWWGRSFYNGSGSNLDSCFLNPLRPRFGFGLRLEGTSFGREGLCVNKGYCEGGFGKFEDNDESLELGFCISDLLSLSVPVDEIIPMRYV